MGKKVQLKAKRKTEWWQPEGYDVRFRIQPLSGPTRREIQLLAGAAVVGRHGAEILRTVTGKVGAGEFILDELVRAAVIDWEGIESEAGDPVPFTAESLEVFLHDCEDEDLLNLLRTHVHDMGEPIAEEKKSSEATPSSTSPASSPAETNGSSGLPTAASASEPPLQPTPRPDPPALPDGTPATPAPPEPGSA